MSYNVSRSFVFKNLYSNIYLSKRLAPKEDSNGNQISAYSKAIQYIKFNIQPLKDDSEIREFGELSPKMKVATITNRALYENTFNEFDLAYLDGSTPANELKNGDNANYYIYAVKKQNTLIKIYFMRRV